MQNILKTMIKKILASIFIFNTFILLAQVPNGGFEDWSTDGLTPNGWVTTNGLMALDNPQSIFKSTDAHTGNFACAIQTVKLINPPPGGVFVPEYYGSIFIGVQKFPEFIYGFPFKSKPTMLRFWYKYNARNNDSVRISVTTTKWNTTKNNRDTISNSIAFLFDSVGVYTKAEILLNLRDTINTADTALMFFSSSNLFSTKPGATFYIDDIEFAGGNVSIPKINEDFDFEVYPNPINANKLQIQLFKEDLFSVSLTNIQGQTIYKQNDIEGSRFEINNVNLSKGIYFLKIETKNFIKIKKIIFE